MIGAACLVLTLQPAHAQNSANSSADAARASLAEKARALESRGRPDMAIQLWQQILLSDPRNSDALANLAKDYKLIGSDSLASQTLDRLRAINPSDPDIARIESMSSSAQQSQQLAEAGELTRQGRNDDAMRIYRQLYGDQPPNGDIALAYYQTLYGSTNGKPQAIAGLRALVARNPTNPRYAIALGIMLTYDQHTRAEGIRILQAHSSDPGAQTALRQALIWDSANPASAAELRDYLKSHPQDTELATALVQDQKKLAAMNTGIARTPAERAAFAALNAGHLDEADRLFAALLQKDPTNGRAAAGVGFLRMRQQDFASAINYFNQAEQNGYKATIVEDALSNSRFWLTMGEATQAFNQNRFDVADAKFRAALAIDPRSTAALNGLAGLYIKEQQYATAAGVYQLLIKVQPASFDGWRGLFLATARAGENDQALAIAARFPPSVRIALDKDPEFLRTLATIYQAQGRTSDAERTLVLALALPFPGNGSTLKDDTKLEYAGILMAAKRFPQAIALYSQVVANSPTNVSAWMGLVSAHHELGQDAQAINDVQRIPAATYETALGDPGFLSELGAIYQQANQYDVAQGMLERAEKLELAAGHQPAVSLQLQLAAINLLRGNTDQAFAIYRQVLAAHPDNAAAWKGIISTLAATNRNSQALQELAQIPASVRAALDSDIDFIQTEAGLYASTGDTNAAVASMNRVIAYYAKLKQQLPPSIDIQNAWLLYNIGNDRALYAALMRIGGRSDLTLAQRQTVQNIWAEWSVRRAAAAMDNGNARRAVDILDAASQAFPNNLTVTKAVAGGYARVGRAKEALVIYRSVPMQDASAGDFEGAVGAALAANDRNQAELWLREALERFPRDPTILSLAARYEQARGDNQRAADYYRASIAAMPAVTPVDRLAHVLVEPDTDNQRHRAVTAADLQHLLDPDYEPFDKTTQLPPLPAYGPDPDEGRAPVIVPQAHPASQTPSNVNSAPDSNDLPPPPPQSLIAPKFVPDALPAPNALRGDFAQKMIGHPERVRAANESKDLRLPFAIHTHHEPGCPVQASLGRDGTTTIPVRMSGRPILKGQVSGASECLVPAALKFTRPRASWRSSIRSDYAPFAALQSSSDLAAPDLAPLDLTFNPPHSLASDAWKGLIFSLMAANRNAEALGELNKIPAEPRRLLESDIEWVQAVASLYVAVGDSSHANAYVHRVETFYLLHRELLPAALEIQHAWLLYSLQSDSALYPILTALDARTDLTADQLRQLQTLWANWALRRANQDLAANRPLHAVQILEAAAAAYPSNLDIRFALAGAYARIGRWPDALAFYKALPMNQAATGDFQGAIWSAISARDMAQAEIWLRAALDRFPSDPNVLSLAASFEQARGNKQRAAQFWRAAIAAAPPGSSVQNPSANPAYPATSPAQNAGDVKRLLNPNLHAPPSAEELAPLPSYKSFASPEVTIPPPPTSTAGATPASNNPLPLRFADVVTGQSAEQGTAPPEQGTSQFDRRTATPTPPVFVPPSAAGNTNSPRPQSPSLGQLTGRVNPPPSDESTASAPTNDSEAPQPSSSAQPNAPPMNVLAAQSDQSRGAQASNQPAPTSAAVIHSIPNATVPSSPSTAATRSTATTPTPSTAPAPLTPPVHAPGQGIYNTAQYTPSAQDAASGAYSAPQQQPSPQQQQRSALPSPQSTTSPAAPSACQTTVPSCPPAQPAPTIAPTHRKRRKSTSQPTAPAPPTETLGNAPIGTGPETQPPPPSDAQTPSAPAQQTAGSAASDEELQQQNLPPLRGPWIRIQRQAAPPSPRDLAEQQLQAIESGYSGWLGGTSLLNYRSGAAGYSQLAAIESPFEASAPLGVNARITAIARPVFLDSGQADGTATTSVTESQSGATCLIAIPEPIGTYTAGQNFTPCTSPTIGPLIPPAQQNAFGLGGELQLTFPHLAIAGGSTPFDFLVSTFTGRFQWNPNGGPVTISLVRDSVKDSQLSYAGLRDPAGNTLSAQGQIWGGVVANQGQLQFSRGDAESGFYFAASGQYLNGYHTRSNTRVDGTGGAYWRVFASPEFGNLTLGANFFAMHYANNQNAFTHGMGGYFSPQAYFLANVPLNWVGHYGTRWHYNVSGAFGVQAFQENSTPLWPLAGDKPLETSQNNPMLPNVTSVSPNYDFHSQVAYQIHEHWFAGAYLAANNTRNYSYASVGFFVRYTFRKQPSAVAAPTGLFPADGPRPFMVP
ncbi:MAG TPA: cellulose synthase subunit BcsC-related outer membrane protein [Terracidiphilus sp.]